MKKVNLGIDVHGTLDSNPILFKKLILALEELDYDVVVHIITGEKFDDEVDKKLRGFYNLEKKWWDEYFSVETHLLKCGHPYIKNSKGRPVFDETTWNRTKAYYCLFNNITLHIDDEIKYIMAFFTPHIYYSSEQCSDKLYIEHAIKLIKDEIKRNDRLNGNTIKN